MSRMKVVVTDYIEADLDWEAEEMAKRGVDFACHQLKFAPEEDVIAATHDADIVVVNMVKITASLADAWERCKLVIRHGAGYDNIDVPAMTERGILVEYVPDYCMDEVAEHAIALMFACARKIVWSRKVLDESVARGQWDFTPIVPMARLAGKTVGIVGCGRIGSLLYKKLKHFGFNFLICDPYLSERRRKALDIETLDLETVCRGSDFITVHTPLNDETRKLISAQVFEWMKPSAFLVNSSRGGMVDHEALAAALKTGQIAGAGIDVFETEPPEASFPLFGLDNVVLTPHLSWYSVEAGQTIREKILQSIYMHLDGTGPRIPVNPEVLKR